MFCHARSVAPQPRGLSPCHSTSGIPRPIWPSSEPCQPPPLPGPSCGAGPATSAIIATFCCALEPAPIPRSCGRRSGTDGGCSFVHNPDVLITRKPVIWRREHATRIISLTDAPRGFADLRLLDFEAMGRVLFDSEDDAGRSVTVTGSFGTFSFLPDDPAAAK